MLCRLAVTLYRQHRIVQLCQLPQEGSQLHQLCCQAAREAQCSKPVSVGISCRVSTVMMVGFTKPVILLPPQSMQLPASQLHCILLHELYHYRSRDLWLKLGIRIFCCLLWWNPLVYLFKSSVDQILELRCDKHVCSRLSKLEQLQYSSALLEILKIGKPPLALWLPSIWGFPPNPGCASASACCCSVSAVRPNARSFLGSGQRYVC
ncbi:MAG: M56 family metallopeptidase [Oscillospiraceae bacterium]